MPLPELISFDADQTLFDFDRVLAEALEAVAGFLSAHTQTEITAMQLRTVRDEIADAYGDQKIDMLVLRRLSFLSILGGQSESEALADQAMAVFQDIRFGRVYFYDGVETGLAELAKITKLGLITNGNSDPERAGIAHHFDHIVMGEKYPFKKPDPRLFDVLFEKVGITRPNRVIHVGDSLEHDIHGANEIGAVSVWFNPERRANATRIKPDHTIAHFSELLDLVQQV